MSSDTSRDLEKTHPTHEVKYEETTSRRSSRIANAGPAGIFAFASTTFLLSMFNVNTRGIHTPNVIIGMAIFTGGLVQLLAGMWEFPRGYVFGATVFSLYGAFWMSYATMFIPASGVLAAYDGRPDELNNAIGMYLIVWFMVTVMFIPPVMRRNLAITILLIVLAIALLCLSIGSWTQKTSVNRAGGVFGIITGLVAYYIGISEMMSAERTAAFRLPLGVWSRD